MRDRAREADAVVERSRSSAAREWNELKGALRAETGLPMESIAWTAVLGGMAIGLELARRWLRRSRPAP